MRSRWATEWLYHGQDELGAYDLCNTCAEDPDAAEARFDERGKVRCFEGHVSLRALIDCMDGVGVKTD